MDKNCPVCGGRSNYSLTKDALAYFQCTECQFLFCGEKLETTANPVDYDGSYWDAEAAEALRREHEDCFLRAMELVFLSNIPVTNIMDFGCGLGVTVDMLRDKFSLNAVGVDPFGQFEPNEHLHKSYLNDLRSVYPPGFFDAIYSVEVFEHLEDPKTVLRELLYFLKDDGKLLINTGTLEFLQRDDPDMHYIDPRIRGHISIFSLKSLQVLAAGVGRKAGFMADRRYAVLMEPVNAVSQYPLQVNLDTLGAMGAFFKPMFREYMRLVYLEEEFENHGRMLREMSKLANRLKL